MLVHCKIILLLVGTTLTSGHVLRNKRPHGSWKPTANHILMSPNIIQVPSSIEHMDLSSGSFLSKFWPQQKTNLFYKPHITMSPVGMSFAAEMPGKDCDEHKTMEIKPIPEIPQPHIPIMVEELPQHSPIVEVIEHNEPLVIPQAPQLPPLQMPEIPAAIQPEVVSSEPEELQISYIREFKPIDIPKAPELPPLAMPEIPAFVEKVPELCDNSEEPLPEYKPIPTPPEIPPVTVSKTIDIEVGPEYQYVPIVPETVQILPEIPKAPELPLLTLPELQAKIDLIPSSPEFPPLHLPEPPFISSYSPDEQKESEICSEWIPGHIPAAPQLPTLSLPEITSPEHIDVIPENKPINIPPALELSHFIMPELPAPIEIASHILEESTPGRKPIKFNIPAATVQITESNPLPNPPELPTFVAHEMEPIIVENPSSTHDEVPCIKEEERPTFISQPLQSPMMYPMFLAQNIIIERMVPNLYLSHSPNTERFYTTPLGHPVTSDTYLESEVY